MRLIDAHSHIHVISNEFYSDFLNFIDHNGPVSVFINSETPDETEIFSLIEKLKAENSSFTNLLFFSALHPWKTEKTQNWIDILEKKLEKDRSLLIGETGLDRFRGADIETQKDIFRSHIELAVKYRRPFTVHCVKEWGICTEVIRESVSENRRPAVPFILHSFSGSCETMDELVRLGGYISFSASMILNGNKKTADNIGRIRTDRLLIETDFPYSAKNGNGNLITFKNGNEAGDYYVSMLKKAYSRAAFILNISEEKLCGVIEENGKIFTDYTAYRRD